MSLPRRLVGLTVVAAVSGRQILRTHDKIRGVNRTTVLVHDDRLEMKAESQVDRLPTNVKPPAQVGQDETVAAIFQQKRGGYFVDLAANDYHRLSNTYALERNLGWAGVCIEANPKYLPGLVVNRSCSVVQAIVSSRDGDTVDFAFHEMEFEKDLYNSRKPWADQDVRGGIVSGETDNRPGQVGRAVVRRRDGYILTKTVSLLTILERVDAPTFIDYLSLDVEGAEGMIIRGFPFGKPYIFGVMSVERPRLDLVNCLRENNYRLVYRDSRFGDSIYAHASLPDYNAAVQRGIEAHHGRDPDMHFTDWVETGNE